MKHVMSAWLALAGLVSAAAVAWACEPAEQPELRCLALNVYWEARSGMPLEQQAIAHVTLNRLAHPGFPGSLCAVVRQGGEDPSDGCQFSWWCDGRSDEPQNPEAWCKALQVARDALARRSQDPTDGALFFHLASIQADWTETLLKVGRIGEHVFYK